MKTTKKILAMLLTCMLAACPVAVGAEGEGNTSTTITNLLSPDETQNGGYVPNEKNFEAISASDSIPTLEKITDASISLPDGSTATSYFSVKNEYLVDKNTDANVMYQTASDIPAQRYVFSVYYNTSTENVGAIRFVYVGDGNPASKTLGRKRFAASLPATGGRWKQFVLIWDASTDTIVDADGKTYITDDEGAALELNGKKQTLQGCYIYLSSPKLKSNPNLGEDDYLYFCNPVLSPLETDVADAFQPVDTFIYDESSESYTFDTYGSGTAVYNFLGVRENAVTAGAETSFKLAPASLSAKDAKAQTGQVLLAAYEETENGKQLTNIEILPFTEGIGGAVGAVPAEFAGKRIEAYFWASDGTLKPLATPVTVTVEAASADE